MTVRPIRAPGVTALLVAPAAALPLAQRPADPRPLQPAPTPRAGSGETRDLDALYRIEEERLQRSPVMDPAWYRTDVHDPPADQLTRMHAAGDWASAQLQEWGLTH